MASCAEVAAFLRWKAEKPLERLKEIQEKIAAKALKARVGRVQGRRNTKARSAENRAFFLEKLGGRCVDCGYSEKSCALDFDHIDPDTKTCDLSAIMGGLDRERIWAEVQKCEVRCARCHRIRTVEQGHNALWAKKRLTSSPACATLRHA